MVFSARYKNLRIYSQKYSTDCVQNFLWLLIIGVLYNVNVEIYTRLFSKIDSEVSVAGSQRATSRRSTFFFNCDILEKPVASKKKGSYIKITPEEKAKIARYTIENGNCAAARKFSKHSDLDKTLGESTVRSWVAIYKKELERKRRMGETVPEITVLPQAKKGRLLIGEKLDSAVKAYMMYMKQVELSLHPLLQLPLLQWLEKIMRSYLQRMVAPYL